MPRRKRKQLPEVQTDPLESPMLYRLASALAAPYFMAYENVTRPIEGPTNEIKSVGDMLKSEKLRDLIETGMWASFGMPIQVRKMSYPLGTRQGLIESMVNRAELYKGRLSSDQRMQEAIRMDKILRLMEGERLKPINLKVD